MPTFKEDHKLGTMVPLIKTDDLNDGCIDYSKLDDTLKSILMSMSHNADMLAADIDLDGQIDAFVSGERPSRYRVVSNVKKRAIPIGILDIISDAMGHQLTEILITNYILEEGEGATEGTLTFDSHADGKLYRYYRFYNRSMANPPDGLKRGVWSKWRKGSDDWTNDVITDNAGGGGGGSVNLSAYLKKSEAEALYVKKDEIPSGTTIGVITNSEIDTLFK